MVPKAMDGSASITQHAFSHRLGMSHPHNVTRDCKLNQLSSLLMVLSVLFLAMSPSIAKPQHEAWMDVRDDFLQGDPELMQFHCERGTKANPKGLSVFNDAWVKEIQILRFEAGVAKAAPDGSNIFFAGLSAAMNSRCPGVW